MIRALLVALLLRAAGPGRAACDDAMDGNRGRHLRGVELPAWGAWDAAALPPPDAWVRPLLDPLLRDPRFVRDVFGKRGCAVGGYGLTKLCVPRNGTVGGFRARARLKSSCGLASVDLRVAVTPRLARWRVK